MRERKGITVNYEDGKDECLFLNTSTLVHSLSLLVSSSFHIVGTTTEKDFKILFAIQSGNNE